MILIFDKLSAVSSFLVVGPKQRISVEQIPLLPNLTIIHFFCLQSSLNAVSLVRTYTVTYRTYFNTITYPMSDRFSKLWSAQRSLEQYDEWNLVLYRQNGPVLDLIIFGLRCLYLSLKQNRSINSWMNEILAPSILSSTACSELQPVIML